MELVKKRPSTYKLTEKFYSLKGEGLWVGTPMCFIRTSQCPVGGTSGLCTTWDGHKFVCDTGEAYRNEGPRSIEWHSYNEVNETMTGEQVWEWAYGLNQVQHIVVTGGEPLIYDLAPLVDALPRPGCKIHIETSGTEDQSKLIEDERECFWVAVSPKQGCLESMVQVADEIKLLIYGGTSEIEVLDWIHNRKLDNQIIYLQPIEALGMDAWHKATLRAMDIVKKHPWRFRFSTQVHKYLNVR